MRKLASIVEIKSCDHIPNTERLSVATMTNNSWKVVTGRDEYKPGDLCIFFEIDSALPVDDERYAFLRNRCLRKFVTKSGAVLKEVYRIKTAKLRGVVSQGLLMPISAFHEITDNIVSIDGHDVYLEKISEERTDYDKTVAIQKIQVVGADVTALLHVEHYDELKAALAPEIGTASIPSDSKMSDYPMHLCPKTDEDRIQCYPEYFSDLKGRKFEVTEKRDGQSITCIYSPRLENDPFAVCSRNMRLKRITDKGVVPQPWQTIAKIGAEKKISDYCIANHRELAVQGELQGAGINGNRDILPDFTWDVFKIYDCIAQQYLLPDEAHSICFSLGLHYVPVIDSEMDVFNTLTNVDALLKFAEGKTARGNEREGLVFKSCDEPYVTFKAISNRYLLKEND